MSSSLSLQREQKRGKGLLFVSMRERERDRESRALDLIKKKNISEKAGPRKEGKKSPAVALCLHMSHQRVSRQPLLTDTGAATPSRYACSRHLETGSSSGSVSSVEGDLGVTKSV